MKYFSPETSKKLEELGLEHFHIGETHEGSVLLRQDGTTGDFVRCFSTLDICEPGNAKKLWGGVQRIAKFVDEDGNEHGGEALTGNLAHINLKEYITLTDEERIKYVTDSLHE